MTKIKNREVVAIYNFLVTLRGSLKGVKLSPSDWKVLSENEEKIEGAVRIIDSKRRELVKEYADGETNENGDIKVSDDKKEAFTDAFILYYEDDADIELNKIPLENLGEAMQGEVGIIEFMKFMVD